jgi:uncharacterized protein (UPF0297 family)
MIIYTIYGISFRLLLPTDGQGFHGILIQPQSRGHYRSCSSSRKLGKNSARDLVLEEIIRAYIDRIRASLYSPPSTIYSDASGFLSVDNLTCVGRDRGVSCPGELKDAGKNYQALRRWGSMRETDFLQKIQIGKILEELVEAPFPVFCRQLHNLEKSNKTEIHDIDIVVAGKLSTSGWNIINSYRS